MNRNFKPLQSATKNFDRTNHRKLVSKRSDYEGTIVSFTNPDGSTRVITLNDKFARRPDGNPMKVSKIIEKLNTLKHDFNALNYKIN